MSEMVPMGAFPALPGMETTAPIKLSRRAKAAIVVRLLINEGADIPLEELPEELQASLTKQMGSMRTVDRNTLASVVEEFAQELESIGLSFKGGLPGRWMRLTEKSPNKPRTGCGKKPAYASTAILGSGCAVLVPKSYCLF